MPRPTTTDEQPVTVRLSVKAWIALFAAQFVFTTSTIGAGGVMFTNVQRDIKEANDENARQNIVIQEIAVQVHQTALTLERVQGRLESQK